MSDDIILRLKSAGVWVRHLHYDWSEPLGYERDSAPFEAADAIESLRARIEALRKDAARLDYLIEEKMLFAWQDEGFTKLRAIGTKGVGRINEPEVRPAIDALIARRITRDMAMHKPGEKP